MSDNPLESLKAQFKLLDTNKDGTLSFDEIKELFINLHSDFSDNEYQQLFSKMDRNHNGQVDMREFIDFLFVKQEGHERLEDGTLVPKLVTKPLPEDWENPVQKPEPKPPECRDPTKLGAWSLSTLAAHNEKRTMHGASPLEWSNDLYQIALKKANECQKRGELIKDMLMIENTFFSTPGFSAEEVVESWYSELFCPGYDFSGGDTASRPEGWERTANFTKLVWGQLTQVGMAVSDDGRYAVARYDVSANCMDPGWYGKYVLPQGSPVSPSWKHMALLRRKTPPGSYRCRKDGTASATGTHFGVLSSGLRDYKFYGGAKFVRGG
eukprot:TRINITY_DN83439_c0_g1_i1.p1 TRINITY_DN83439_c0_g1~~TRINITY_DN83439_c0_g1_i1.p1  ORF type:complete len:324 (+),score=53.77 TRINITY_DN83439_c0_g1_i1:92-1063(+)